MCGRFALGANRGEIRAFEGNNLHVNEWEGEDDFQPRYNIAPRTNAPVVRRREAARGAAGDSRDVPLVMQTMKWGLVPHWSKVEDKTLNTINARAENLVAGGGIWGTLKGSRRCAVPCQGYYEWLTKGKDKLPHFLKRKDGHLLLMAGLYDSAVIDGQTLWTFTIVTTEASMEFSWLHERQPVFLTNKKVLDEWLDTRVPVWTDSLCRIVSGSYHDDLVPLECYQVPQEVGKVGTESPAFIEPVAARKDGIQAFFAKQSSPKKRTSPPTSPSKLKRPRSTSPALGCSSNSGNPELPDSNPVESPSPRKRARRDSLNALSESRKTEVGKSDFQSPTKPSKLPKTRGPKSPLKSGASASPKKSSTAKSEGTAKITSFFGKK